MNYTVQIIIDDDSKKLYECLSSDQKTKNRRSEIVIKKLNEKVKITISAKDAVALRASVGGVTSLLAVYEKTKKLKK